MTDPAKTVALALAKEICRECVYREHSVASCLPFRRRVPCPLFHPDNFYYDSELRRFWCLNWMDNESNQKPSTRE